MRLSALALALTLAGCDLLASLPRDPHETLARIRTERVLRAGWVDAPPFATATGGVERDLVASFAEHQGARVVWRHGGESDLLQALHDGALDVVVGGLDASSPWKAKVAFTKPWPPKGHALHDAKLAAAVRPGENALLVELDRFLRARADDAVRTLAAGPAARRGG